MSSKTGEITFRPIIYTLVPMIFVLFMTLWAMIEQVVFDWSGAGESEFNLLLFSFGAVILGFSIWIMLEAYALFRSKSTD